MSWILSSSLLLGAALVVGFAWYERTHPSSRVIALVATLAALAALGRIAFAPLPNVKPTTDIVLLAGFVLGGAPGFVIGAVAALGSNLFFGQGPWTPWQMVAWGAVGVLGALLARLTRRRLGRIPLAAACGVAGLGFGAIMNLHMWITYSGDHTAAKLGATFATSFPFDVAHALGNVVFCLAFGPALVRALERYRTRMEVTWLPAPAATAAVLLLAVLAVAPAPARADATADAAAANRSLAYLAKAQNDDGGWGGAPGQGSSSLHTGWAALGVASAGRNPRDVGSPSAVAYVRSHDPRDLGEVTRTILVLRAAGLPAGDLLDRLLAKRRPNGSFAGRVNTTAFAALALEASGGSPRALKRAGRWIASQANRDGGFNFAGRGGPSGIDDTGAAVQGLVASGRGGTKTVKRAVRYLLRRQNSDGGFPLTPGGASNAQSTAWAVQAFLAAGRNPANVRRGGSRDPMAFLRSLTAPSGEVRYSRTSRQTPVWVTAQAVMALARKPLPLAPVPRARRASPAAAPTATPAPPATAAATPEKRKRKPEPTPRSTPAAEASRAPSPLATTVVAAVAAPRRAGYVAGAVAAALM